MQIVNFKEASINLDAVFNTVYQDSEAVIMHKENGQKVVMIPFEEYSSMRETSYLFASPKNKEHLTTSLKELRSGRGVQRDIIE
ncbi:MAG: type II toxin-antitoxin system Phd/YefM family antitoxin [Arcobacteraceae bacterium]